MALSRQQFSEVKTVSCAEDRLDLRPAVDAIVAEVRKRAGQGRPLVVLVGEAHDISSHLVLQQMVMAKLAQPGGEQEACRIAYGLERPHDYLETIIRRGFGLSLPESVRGLIGDGDRDGQRLMAAFHAAIMPVNAPVTERNVMAFCWNSEIPVHANDAAIDSTYLDLSDPATHALVERYAPDKLGTPVHVFDDPLGTELRNRMIAGRVVAHAKEMNAGIYIQQCGKNHLFGQNGKGFDTGLATLLAEAGVDVLPVFITDRAHGIDKIPPEAAGFLKQGLIIDGLSDAQFSFHSAPGAEAAFLEELNRHSGGEIGLLEENDDYRKQLSAHLRTEIPSWITEARPHSP